MSTPVFAKRIVRISRVRSASSRIVVCGRFLYPVLTAVYFYGELGALTLIHVLPVPDFDHEHDEHIIVNLVNDTVVANSDAV